MTTSVNVPPTSIPIEKLIGSSLRLGRGFHTALALQRVDVELDVPGQWMTGRKIFILDEGAASRTINLDKANPFRVRREVEFRAGPDGLVYLARIAVRQNARQLVRFACRPEIMVAAIAAPPLGLGIDVEIFGDPHPHSVPPGTAPFMNAATNSRRRHPGLSCSRRALMATGPCQLSKDQYRLSAIRTNDRLTVKVWANERGDVKRRILFSVAEV